MRGKVLIHADSKNLSKSVLALLIDSYVSLSAHFNLQPKLHHRTSKNQIFWNMGITGIWNEVCCGICQYFQLKKWRDSSSSWNSRPKRVCQLRPSAVGWTADAVGCRKLKMGEWWEQTKWNARKTQEKRTKTHKGYKFSESSRQNWKAQKMAVLADVTKRTIREASGKTCINIGARTKIRWHKMQKNNIVYSHVLFTCAHCSRQDMWYVARRSWGLGFLTFQLACPTPRFP